MEEVRSLKVTSPQTEKDWQDYYDLRWRILRAPWNQPKGSERVDDDSSSFHAMIRMHEKVIACGRIHFLTHQTAQVRFMAVDKEFQRMGLGAMVLAFLEAHARKSNMQKIILQAREEAIPFYTRNGYSVVRKTELLFGSIQHYLMEKQLS
jgi:N-acetylglutamate synthase-like GNAT family acetyltransferase